ncbi:histone-like nucleoid-structuring protein Lsr2 [Streptomyces sp. H27-H5]|uniref:histone-like nucleoid-structuring protein Lsr2 n=1 Tax=Streptomyces sp. H27-H5 TaxID=2996460 RepID=UPI00226EFA1D|nr:Lsr2 family protein [Streptomyces sp. H27-H5]MCY0955816.1 Lsr2 family protein [Streptomyces sp. H27-H5]
MATITQLIMIDDLDGTESIEPGEINTVRFHLDGVEYEVDLTQEHDQELRELLAPYLEVARRKAGGTGRPRSRRGSTDPETAAQEHYQPIDVPEKEAKGWHKRTSYGCERTNKVRDMTLTERIAALTPNNVKVLGQYLGEIPTSSGRRPSLGNTGQRFRNLEILDWNWEVTDFGRYVFQVRSDA